MPPKISPNDWDNLFRPNAPRRGGPLRALANLLLIGAAVTLLGGGAVFALSFGLDYAQESAARTAERVATNNAIVIATRTARALETSATAVGAAAAATPTAAAPPLIGRSSVVAGGNLRSQPVIAEETVIGQICAGDQLDVLEQSSSGDATWYRVRITQEGPSCSAQRVSIGSIGWANSTLLAPVAP